MTDKRPIPVEQPRSMPLSMSAEIERMAAAGYGHEDILVKLKIPFTPLMRMWVRGIVLGEK